jgi:hypothetical protein
MSNQLDQMPDIDFLIQELNDVINNHSHKTEEYRKGIPKQNKRLMNAIAALTKRTIIYHGVSNAENGRINGLTEQALSKIRSAKPLHLLSFFRVMWALPVRVRRELIELLFFTPLMK